MKKILLIASAILILAVLTCSFTLSATAQDEPPLGVDFSHIQVFTQIHSETEYHMVSAKCHIVETGESFYTDPKTGYSALITIHEPGTYTVTATYQGETLTQVFTFTNTLPNTNIPVGENQVLRFVFTGVPSPTTTPTPTETPTTPTQPNYLPLIAVIAVMFAVAVVLSKGKK